MSALAKPSRALAPGLARSARLMRALGPDAAPIWAELEPEESEALSAAMDRLADDPSADADALRRFTQVRKATSGAGVWSQLSALDTPVLASLLRNAKHVPEPDADPSSPSGHVDPKDGGVRSAPCLRHTLGVMF
jgi:flagellar motor switch protein FliG